jgi:hypothetical protein
MLQALRFFAITMLRIILQRPFPTINTSSVLLLEKQLQLLIPPTIDALLEEVTQLEAKG